MSTLLTYDHPRMGPATILIEVPNLPLEISLRDDPYGRISVDLAGARANTIQVGPCGRGNRDVQVRAFNEQQQKVDRVVTSILPGAVFSQTARAGGNSTVIQCGGDMVMGGHGRKDGAYVSAPVGCLFELRGHGPAIVKFEEEMLTVPQAVARRLMRLPS